MKIFKSVISLAVVALLVNACKKEAVTPSMGDAGQTIVKFQGGDPVLDTLSAPQGYDYHLININLLSTPQVLDIADVRRDLPNNTELNRTMNIIVKDAPQAVTNYNTLQTNEFGSSTNLVPLPAGSYTIDASTPLVGSEYHLTMAPGDFAKQIKFTLLDATSLDLNLRYGFGFTINTVDADGHISVEHSTIVVEVGVKNKWDGVYSLHGYFVHPTQTQLVGPVVVDDGTIELRTTGQFTDAMFWQGATAHPIMDYSSSPAQFTYFGSQQPVYKFTEVSPTVTNVSVTNSFTGGTNVIYVSAPTYPNRYDNATKTIYARYTYNGASRIYTDTLRFLHAR